MAPITSSRIQAPPAVFNLRIKHPGGMVYTTQSVALEVGEKWFFYLPDPKADHKEGSIISRLVKAGKIIVIIIMLIIVNSTPIPYLLSI